MAAYTQTSEHENSPSVQSNGSSSNGYSRDSPSLLGSSSDCNSQSRMGAPTGTSPQCTTFISSNSRVHQSKSPHGVLPLRQLVPIKIEDRQSCFVHGLDHSIAKDEILRSSKYFGQFGVIISIRFILNSDPAQALLRFATEQAAARAMAWCNQQTSDTCPISAKYGYQKYCISFIKNKQCVKPGCPHRHRWCAPDDIITIKNQTFKVSDTPSDIFLRNKKKKKGKTVTQSGALVHPPTGNEVAVSGEAMSAVDQSKQLLIVQRQFSILQMQHTQQTESVKMLLLQMKSLQAQNRALQQVQKENQMLKQQLAARSQQYRPAAPAQQHVQHHGYGYASGYAHAHVQPPQAPPMGVVPYYPSSQLPMSMSPPKQQKHAVFNSSTDEEMVSDIIDSLFQSDEFACIQVSESSDTN